MQHLQFDNQSIPIDWDESSTIVKYVRDHPGLAGEANNIPGEVFFYQFELEIPLDQTKREVFEKGDVVYWRSPTDESKFGILFMYGNTTYGDGTKPRASSPGIKIGSIKAYDKISEIQTGTNLRMA
jgi:hypothetical protein